MIDYAASRAVAMVVQTGSFEAAARALNVTPSAISQRVRNLEERLGTVLIERGAPCVATDTGALLCRHMENVGALETELHAHLPGLGDTPAMPVTLPIATNADSLATWFLPAAAAFARDSDCLLNIAVDDEDHTADWLRRGRVVAAVTALGHPVQGCAVTALGALDYVATASPSFVERHFPDGVTAEAISRAPTITFDRKDRLQQDWVRRTFDSTIVVPTHWLPSSHGFVDATLEGLGWTLNPVRLVGGHLASGRLVELVPGARLQRPLFWQASRLSAGRLSPLARAIIEAARRELVSTAVEPSSSGR